MKKFGKILATALIFCVLLVACEVAENVVEFEPFQLGSVLGLVYFTAKVWGAFWVSKKATRLNEGSKRETGRPR